MNSDSADEYRLLLMMMMLLLRTARHFRMPRDSPMLSLLHLSTSDGVCSITRHTLARPRLACSLAELN
jgi:hypothetical protein